MLTAQDPASSATKDEEYLRRHRRALQRRRFWPKNLVRAVARRLRNRQTEGFSAMEQETSEPLMAKGIITRSMDEKSIYAVTDFHVPGQPGNMGSGIDPGKLGQWMPEMKLVAPISYAFHGLRWTALTSGERRRERNWLESGDPHGSQIATVWQRP